MKFIHSFEFHDAMMLKTLNISLDFRIRPFRYLGYDNFKIALPHNSPAFRFSYP
jgi:hypothetical protein